MALHISGKLMALGLVVTALITAFSAPTSDGSIDPAQAAIEVAVEPFAVILDEPAEATPTALAFGPTANPTFELRATGYNSLVDQTDSTPFITATGARTRFGIVAVSRDLLGVDLPYGSLVRLTDLGSYYSGRGAGAFQTMLDAQGLFIVEDTMHARKAQQLDVWFADYATAVNWGVRRVGVELVRFGRNGPELEPQPVSAFDATPGLLTVR